MNPDAWEETLNVTDNTGGALFNNHLKLGIDYWLRLKNWRVEFLPTLSVAISDGNGLEDNFFRPQHMQNVGFHINTQFYLFDFAGDCDCPTWSKEGNFFTKGFFVNVAPGVTFHRFTTDISSEANLERLTSTDFKFDFGVGIGLDIGVNNLLTVTPFFNYYVKPGVSYDSLERAQVISSQEINVSQNLYQSEFGIRIGFRPDYEKPTFR